MPQVYFRTVGLCKAAVVKIQNDTNCDMIAIVRMKTKEISQAIRQAQQVSLVLPSISLLSIVCTHEGEEAKFGRGTYAIRYRRRSSSAE